MWPLEASMRKTPFAFVVDPYEAAAMTPAPSMPGVPMIEPVRPVCQMICPVAGLTCMTEPSKAVLLIVVPFPARYRWVPSKIGAASHCPGPTVSGLPSCSVQTGPAESDDALKAKKIPSLLHAPTILVATPPIFAVHTPGEPPKSLSVMRCASGTDQLSCFFIDSLSFTIE